MQTIRILLAADHPVFRDGLKRLLDADPRLRVVGEAGTGPEAVQRVSELSPDVLLLDLSMPDGSGFDVLRALERNTGVRTILLTADLAGPEFLQALQLGARGLVRKDAATTTLTKCIPAVMAGEYWFGRDRLGDLVQALRFLRGVAPSTPGQTLTACERRIVAAVVDGCTNRDIATELGLSGQTIKNYLSHIYDKLGVSNRLELALYAVHHKQDFEAELREIQSSRA
jgi:DNA-binding NarL/FixJ family response regulator